MEKNDFLKNIKIIIDPSKKKDQEDKDLVKCAGIVCVGVCSSDVPPPL